MIIRNVLNVTLNKRRSCSHWFLFATTETGLRVSWWWKDGLIIQWLHKACLKFLNYLHYIQSIRSCLLAGISVWWFLLCTYSCLDADLMRKKNSESLIKWIFTCLFGFIKTVKIDASVILTIWFVPLWPLLIWIGCHLWSLFNVCWKDNMRWTSSVA